MDNLKLPAFPTTGWEESGKGPAMFSNYEGFTKLEYAAILILAGMSSKIYSEGTTDKQVKYMAESSVLLAKAVLEEANK